MPIHFGQNILVSVLVLTFQNIECMWEALVEVLKYNGMKDLNGSQFSTIDMDNDKSRFNCVSFRGGGGVVV